MTFRLFVYGTLRPGFAFGDHVVHRASEVIPGTITGTLHEGPGYPYLVLEGDNTVHGDVLVFPDEAMDIVKYIHRVEIGAGYRLREVMVQGIAPEEFKASTYELDPHRLHYLGPVIKCGDFREHEQHVLTEMSCNPAQSVV